MITFVIIWAWLCQGNQLSKCQKIKTSALGNPASLGLTIATLFSCQCSWETKPSSLIIKQANCTLHIEVQPLLWVLTDQLPCCPQQSPSNHRIPAFWSVGDLRLWLLSHWWSGAPGQVSPAPWVLLVQPSAKQPPSPSRAPIAELLAFKSAYFSGSFWGGRLFFLRNDLAVWQGSLSGLLHVVFSPGSEWPCSP